MNIRHIKEKSGQFPETLKDFILSLPDEQSNEDFVNNAMNAIRLARVLDAKRLEIIRLEVSDVRGSVR
jgi:hypothetical protein